MSKTTSTIDPLARPMVEYFNRIGLKTHMSCQGHGIPNMSLFWIQFAPSVTEQDIVRFQQKHLDKYGGFPANGRFVQRIIAWSTGNDCVDRSYQYIAADANAASEDLERWMAMDVKKTGC